MRGCWPSKPSWRKGHTRQTCCHPAQLLPSGQHSILSRTSCSALPWLQRWRGWGCKLWEHTHTHTRCSSLVALTAIWRWRSSHIAHWASCVCVMQHATSSATSMTCFFFFPSILKTVYQHLLLVQCWWQTYSLSTCFFFFLFFFVPLLPEGISTGHPSPTQHLNALLTHHRSSLATLPSPHHLRRPVSRASAGRCLAGRPSLFLLMIYCIITRADSGY